MNKIRKWALSNVVTKIIFWYMVGSLFVGWLLLVLSTEGFIHTDYVYFGFMIWCTTGSSFATWFTDPVKCWWDENGNFNHRPWEYNE